MNKELKDEYRRVRFRCGNRGTPPAFFIVTAHNPDGGTVGDEANRQANLALRAEIERNGHDCFAVTGGSPDFAHSEPGFGVPCPREEALGLARRFRQDAVFRVEDGRVYLVSALDLSTPDEDIGKWEDLVLDHSGLETLRRAE